MSRNRFRIGSIAVLFVIAIVNVRKQKTAA